MTEITNPVEIQVKDSIDKVELFPQRSKLSDEEHDKLFDKTLRLWPSIMNLPLKLKKGVGRFIPFGSGYNQAHLVTDQQPAKNAALYNAMTNLSSGRAPSFTLQDWVASQSSKQGYGDILYYGIHNGAEVVQPLSEWQKLSQENPELNNTMLRQTTGGPMKQPSDYYDGVYRGDDGKVYLKSATGKTDVAINDPGKQTFANDTHSIYIENLSFFSDEQIEKLNATIQEMLKGRTQGMIFSAVDAGRYGKSVWNKDSSDESNGVSYQDFFYQGTPFIFRKDVPFVENSMYIVGYKSGGNLNYMNYTS